MLGLMVSGRTEEFRRRDEYGDDDFIGVDIVGGDGVVGVFYRNRIAVDQQFGEFLDFICELIYRYSTKGLRSMCLTR